MIVMQAAKVLQLSTISYVLNMTFTYGIYALIVIFQPELRRMLEQVGKGKMVSGLLASAREHEESTRGNLHIADHRGMRSHVLDAHRRADCV